ncbi:hypothetical protein [Haloplanus vescus]|nr:hypothetical protein [Haloplanus vescus]
METTVTFEYGPLTVEIHARDDENYQDEILDLLRFLENHQEQFEEIGVESEVAEMKSDKTGTVSLDQFEDGERNEEDEEEPDSTALGSIASELQLSVTNLKDFLYVDSDGDDFPVIYVDEFEDIGERQTDRQRVASLILLYLWHECYDKDRVKSGVLKDALELSNVSSSGMANMYQGEGDRYFDRRGRGPTATVALTPPGKRQARKVLRRLANEKKES